MADTTDGASPSQEQHVWDLLTRRFRWHVPESLGVRVDGATAEPASLQVFEVASAAVFAALRPDYDWYVTGGGSDGGVDFIGRHELLRDSALGIAAAITIGGQCKKRTRVDDIVQEVSGSLARMISTLDPTMFIVALSARLDRQRVDEARRIVERAQGRHCHILDRGQLDALLGAHIDVLDPILRAALDPDDAADVRNYLSDQGVARPIASVNAPTRVLAGEPFHVHLTLGPSAAPRDLRLFWRDPTDPTSATVVGPIGVETPRGALIDPAHNRDLVDGDTSIELLSYAVGSVSLGEVAVVAGGRQPRPDDWHDLGAATIVENTRPRFFDRPYREALAVLGAAVDRASAGGVETVGVVGSAGSGKSRLCEEFGLAQRRSGATVISAAQAKTYDDPNRLVAELLLLLSRQFHRWQGGADPTTVVLEAVRRLDAALAEELAAHLPVLFGQRSEQRPASDQPVLSSIIVLLSALATRQPVLVHLQELHWCTADVLNLIERLTWQMNLAGAGQHRRRHLGVTFLFEGRDRERGGGDDAAWHSAPFEAFLSVQSCDIARCRPFAPPDRREFIARLFEGRHSTDRQLPDDLLPAQEDLIDWIDRTAGGNPFHTLEQIRLLQARGKIARNPSTGLVAMVEPSLDDVLLPESVVDVITLRWRDLQARQPGIALLVWACALLDDRLPQPLFRLLRQAFAPTASLAEIEATEILEATATTVGFRHENYFHAIRNFEVDTPARQQAVAVYLAWFTDTQPADPIAMSQWGRAHLALPVPDLDAAQTLLTRSEASATEAGDVGLARRIRSLINDVTWTMADREGITTVDLVAVAERELELVAGLLSSDRHTANNRLHALTDRLATTQTEWPTSDPQVSEQLYLCELRTKVLRSQLLYNDRQLEAAISLAGEVVALAQAHTASDDDWAQVEMDARHSQAVAFALAGQVDRALIVDEPVDSWARAKPPSTETIRIIASFANILLARDPRAAELRLRDCRTLVASSPTLSAVSPQVDVNLAMALVVQAAGDSADRQHLAEARQLLGPVFESTHRVGSYLSSAAASLMLGIVAALDDTDSAGSWFAQAVAAASRGNKPETLWRAHLNLAAALSLDTDPTNDAVQAHAKAGATLLRDSLTPYATPGESPRFEWIKRPLAQATRFLAAAGDPLAESLSEQISQLADAVAEAPDAPATNHEWIVVDGVGYVIY